MSSQPNDLEQQVQFLQLQLRLLMQEKINLSCKVDLLTEENRQLRQCLHTNLDNKLIHWIGPYDVRLNKMLESFEKVSGTGEDEDEAEVAAVCEAGTGTGEAAVCEEGTSTAEAAAEDETETVKTCDDDDESEREYRRKRAFSLNPDEMLISTSGSFTEQDIFLNRSKFNDAELLLDSDSSLAVATSPDSQSQLEAAVSASSEYSDPETSLPATPTATASSPIPTSALASSEPKIGRTPSSLDKQLISSFEKTIKFGPPSPSGPFTARNTPPPEPTKGKVIKQYAAKQSDSKTVAIVALKDIYSEIADAVVVSSAKDDLTASSASPSMSDIFKKGGSDLSKECAKYVAENGRLAPGTCFVGSAGSKLKLRHVIYAFVGSQPLRDDEIEDSLSRLTKAILTAATSSNCRSVTFCPIAGQFNVPKSSAIVGYSAVFKSALTYLRANANTSVTEIRLVFTNEKEAKAAIESKFEQDFIESKIARPLPTLQAQTPTVTDTTPAGASRPVSMATKWADISQDINKRFHTPPGSGSGTGTGSRMSIHIAGSSNAKLAANVADIDIQTYYSIPLDTLTYTEEPDNETNVDYAKPKQPAEDDSAANSSGTTPPVLMSATLTKLVEKLTDHKPYDNTFLYAFMLTYRSITNADTLLELLSERWNYALPSGTLTSKQEFVEFKETVLDRVRLRITQVLKYWLENHYYDFEGDSEQLLAKVEAFLSIMEKSKAENMARQIRRTMDKMKREHSEKSTQVFTNEPPRPIYPKGLLLKMKSLDSIEIMEWPSMEIARQITLIEYDTFRKIRPKECLNQSWNKEHRETKAPNIFAMIQRFNVVSRWICTRILKEENLKKRTNLLAKVIRLGQALCDLNNYNGLFEVISGLNSAPVHRLRLTWDALPPREIEIYNQLNAITSTNHNFRTIRKRIPQVQPPCVPYIGLFLTDLTFIEDGNKNEINGKINFDKRRKLALVIRDLHTYQQTPYELQEVRELRDQLLNLTAPLEENELYDMSLAREPRAKRTPQPADSTE